MKLYISETQSLLEENKYVTLPSKRLKHLKQRPCTGGVLEEDSHTPFPNPWTGLCPSNALAFLSDLAVNKTVLQTNVS